MHSKQQSSHFKRILNPSRTTGSAGVINTLQKTHHNLIKIIFLQYRKGVESKIPWTGSKNVRADCEALQMSSLIQSIVTQAYTVTALSQRGGRSYRKLMRLWILFHDLLKRV